MMKMILFLSKMRIRAKMSCMRRMQNMQSMIICLRIIQLMTNSTSLAVRVGFGTKVQTRPAGWCPTGVELIRALNPTLGLMFDGFCQACPRLAIYRKVRKNSLSSQFNVGRYIVSLITSLASRSSSSRVHHQAVFIKPFPSSRPHQAVFIKPSSSSRSAHHQDQVNLSSQSIKSTYQVNLPSHLIKPPYQAVASTHKRP
jgi:hypothetical protein